MKTTALIRLRFHSKEFLETTFKALEPEVKKSLTVRSRAKLNKEDMVLILKIDAKDTVALRAAVNAYLRWIHSVINVLEVVETL